MPTRVGRFRARDGVSWGSEIAQDTRVTVGSVLAAGFRVWGRNLPRFLLLTVVCWVPLFGWYALHWIDAFDALVKEHIYMRLYDLHPALMESRAFGLGWIPFSVFGGAIAVCTVAELRGERVSIWRGLGLAVRHALSLIVLAFVIRLATYGISVAIQIARWDPRVIFFEQRAGIFWRAFYAVLWLVMSSLFVAALPAAAVERRGPFSAIARGFAILRGNWIKVLAVGIVLYVVVFLLYYGLAQAMLPWVMTGEDTHDRFVIYSNVRVGLEILLFALAPVLAAVIYEHAREAKEGPAPTQLDRVFD